MTTISIIGSGNMATAIGTRAAQHGHTVEIMSRDTAKAQAPADQIGHGATVGTFGARPAGDIVFVAVLYQSAVDVVTHYGDALAGKTLVDITNPFNADASGIVTTEGNSVSQQIAAAAPEGTHVVKAFNTIFRPIIAEDEPLDVVLRRRQRRGEGTVRGVPAELGHAAPRRRRARDDLRPRMGRHPHHGAGPERRRLRRHPGRQHPLTTRAARPPRTTEGTSMPDYGHPLRFGTFIGPTNSPPSRPVELAQLSERLGFDFVTFQDHPYQSSFLDTWTLLAGWPRGPSASECLATC